MSLDLTGEHGGLLAMAFAAGCTACFAFMSVIGKMLGRGKDNEIRLLKAEVINGEARYGRMDAAWMAALEEERRRCDAMETRLVARIQNLEGLVLMVAPMHLRRAVEKEIELPEGV